MDEASARLLSHPAWARLKDLAIGRSGLAYYRDKDISLADRVLQRMARHPGLDPSDYADLLEGEAGAGPETEALIDLITIGETFFFRSREQFEAIAASVVPECAARRVRDRVLTVWSAGCSNGAEAYSLAILLRNHPSLFGWDLRVFGSDISPEAVAAATAGTYGRWSLRGVPEDMVEGCFDRCGDRWRVKEVYRKGVEFFRHNLVAGPPPVAGCDLVLCRNVIMYFDEATRAAALDGLRHAMADGGWLVVSQAEVGPEVGRVLPPVTVQGMTLYRKQAAVPSPRPVVPARPVAPPPLPRRRAKPRLPPPVFGSDQVVELLDRGNWSEAASLCRRWSAEAPTDPAAHYHLGLALEHASEAEAVAAFRRTLYLDPGFGLAHFHLARIYRRRGRGDVARRHIEGVFASLAGLDGDQQVAWGAGMTAAELAEMARLCLTPEAPR